MPRLHLTKRGRNPRRSQKPLESSSTDVGVKLNFDDALGQKPLAHTIPHGLHRACRRPHACAAGLYHHKRRVRHAQWLSVAMPTCEIPRRGLGRSLGSCGNRWAGGREVSQIRTLAAQHSLCASCSAATAKREASFRLPAPATGFSPSRPGHRPAGHQGRSSGHGQIRPTMAV